MPVINIQFTLFSAFYSPLIMVMAGGFLREEGYDHNWSVAPPGKSAMDALVDGSADVIQTAVIQGVNDLENGRTPAALNFALVNAMDGFFITARNPHDNFSWDSLEGSELVTFPGGQPNYMLRYACLKAGIDYSRIQPVTPGGPDQIDAAFRAGQGQFVHQQGPYPQQLEAEGLGHVVARCGPLIGRCAFSTLAAKPEWLDSDAARAFQRAYRNAMAHLATAPVDTVVDTIVSWFDDTDREALSRCIAAYQALGCWSPDVDITQQDYDATLDVFEHAGKLTTRHAFTDLCWSPD